MSLMLNASLRHILKQEEAATVVWMEGPTVREWEIMEGELAFGTPTYTC